MWNLELGNDPACLVDNTMNLAVLQLNGQAAYDSLPDCYKNDHALNFFIDSNNNLCAEHNLHNEEYLWTGEKWVRIK